MRNKKLLIGIVSATILVGGYFYLKNRPRKYGLENEEAEIDFVNANGIGKKIISNLKYETELTKQLMFRNYGVFIGKSVFTKLPNVNVRKSPEIKNGLLNNIAGKIASFNTFLGKVVEVKRDPSGKFLWFGINEINANKKLASAYNWNLIKQPDPSIRWFRSDVVAVNLD
jgi:hypothetical protein